MFKQDICPLGKIRFQLSKKIIPSNKVFLAGPHCVEGETNQEKIATPLLLKKKYSNSKFSCPLWICSFLWRNKIKNIQKVRKKNSTNVFLWPKTHLFQVMRQSPSSLLPYFPSFPWHASFLSILFPSAFLACTWPKRKKQAFMCVSLL